MTRNLRNVYGLGLLLAGLALASAPAILHAQGTIKCEKCTCNVNTGMCECTNCTLDPVNPT